MKYIKLFEHSYSIYDLITLPMWEATELLIEQCEKDNPDMDLVRDLFEYAILDVNMKVKDGFTALILALFWGRTEIVKLLLKRPEIDVNMQDNGGNAAIDWVLASDYNRTEIINLIQSHPSFDPAGL